MNTLLEQPLSERRATRAYRSGIATTIRVYRGSRLLGAMLLNNAKRTVHCTPDVPTDVVLKVLTRFSKRDEVRGEVSSRDGLGYVWHVHHSDDI